MVRYLNAGNERFCEAVEKNETVREISAFCMCV